MLKILGVVTLVVVGLLAWSAVGHAALSEERTASAGAAPAALQLARGGGHSTRTSTYYAREKTEAKAEEKKERETVNEAGKDATGNDSDDATEDTMTKDEVEAGMRPPHHSK